jgi:putative ABC transport system ATP-binding protein
MAVINPAVRMDGIHLTLTSQAGPVNILDDISIEIGAGETVSLVGQSGSGKTSLLLLIAGLERPTRGRVALAGKDTTDLDEDRLALIRRAMIGIVFQSFHLIPTMTAIENVAVPLELSGAENAFGRARDMLAAVGLEHRERHYPAQLSGGEQQRVALARALVARPSIILADEPTGNLDNDTGRRIVDLLFEQTRAIGATLLLITHEAGLAERCERRLRMADGRIVADSRAGAA